MVQTEGQLNECRNSFAFVSGQKSLPTAALRIPFAHIYMKCFKSVGNLIGSADSEGSCF